MWTLVTNALFSDIDVEICFFIWCSKNRCFEMQQNFTT